MAKNRRYESDCCSITFLKYVLHMFNVLLVVRMIMLKLRGVMMSCFALCWCLVEMDKLE